MCRLVLLSALVALEMLLDGCLPVTTASPLGSTVSAVPDPQLTGMWKGNFGTAKGPAYIAFYPARNGVTRSILLTPPTVGDDGGWIVFEAHGARLGGTTYLDAREIEEDGKVADPRLSHVPILYKISPDGFLALYLIDEKAVRAAISNGAIAGTIEPGEFGDVTITAAPATLDAFFASAAGRALFTKPIGILRRVQ